MLPGYPAPGWATTQVYPARITREKMNRHRITRWITRTPDHAPDTGLRAAKGPR